MGIEKEKQTLEAMIALYCNQKHKGKKGLCPDCRGLQTYAMYRLDKCLYGEDKPPCKSCPNHCFKPEMRENIRKVMRYSGPRMILHHPLLTIDHILKTLKK